MKQTGSGRWPIDRCAPVQPRQVAVRRLAAGHVVLLPWRAKSMALQHDMTLCCNMPRVICDTPYCGHLVVLHLHRIDRSDCRTVWTPSGDTSARRAPEVSGNFPTNPTAGAAACGGAGLPGTRSGTSCGSGAARAAAPGPCRARCARARSTTARRCTSPNCRSGWPAQEPL